MTKCAVAIVFVVAVVTSIGAQESRPSRLGIQGRFEYGYGLVIECVERPSPAGRLGLEPGDVIRAIDGRYLRTEADLRRQLRVAGTSSQLIIRDIRTGKLLERPIEVRRRQPR
jgi:S1-C subfamily serine protease